MLWLNCQLSVIIVYNHCIYTRILREQAIKLYNTQQAANTNIGTRAKFNLSTQKYSKNTL